MSSEEPGETEKIDFYWSDCAAMTWAKTQLAAIVDNINSNKFQS